MKILIGTIIELQPSGHYLVECPDAPSHLQVLYLRRWQLGGAKVTDRVELRYQVGSASGLWNVSRVLEK